MTGKSPKRTPRDGVDGYGRTPLHYAAGDGNVDLCMELLSSGADPSLQDDNGWSPLHFAAQANSATVTKVLVDAGANVELRDSHGNTALLKAVFSSRGDGSVIKVLRAVGADANAANNSGVSPLTLSRTVANYDVEQFFGDLA